MKRDHPPAAHLSAEDEDEVEVAAVAAFIVEAAEAAAAVAADLLAAAAAAEAALDAILPVNRVGLVLRLGGHCAGFVLLANAGAATAGAFGRLKRATARPDLCPA